MNEIYTTRELITPERAAEFLSNNRENRNVSWPYVNTIAADILGGRWIENGDSIKFTPAPQIRLVDGQHRLHGICKAGKSVWCSVAHNVPWPAFAVTDVGRRRNGVTVLSLAKEKNTKTLAAGLRWLYNFEEGHPTLDLAVSPVDMLALLDLHPGIRETASVSTRVNVVRHRGLYCALLYLFRQKDQFLAEIFTEQLVSGQPSEYPAFHALRERLVRDTASKARLPVLEVAALIIKAWNLARKKSPRALLRWSNAGETPEEFPSIL